MKKIITYFLTTIFVIVNAFAQDPVIEEWFLNTTGKTASYWENVGAMGAEDYQFNETTTLADVTDICYDNDYVYIKSEGMTNDMGQFSNPGAPSGQGYVFKFPRNPQAGSGNEEAPAAGAVVNPAPVNPVKSIVTGLPAVVTET